MSALVAKRYSKAIFDIAVEKKLVSNFEEELQFLVDTLNENSDLNKLLNHPKVTSAQKKGIVKEVFSSKLSQDVIDFIYILIENHRQNLIGRILEEYKNMSDELNNVLRATAYSVVALDDTQMNLIRLKLSNMFSKTVVLSNKIDESLIGGVYIKTADRIIDGSIKGKLEQLKETMLA